MPIAFMLECISATPKGIQLPQIQGRGLQAAFLEAVRRISPSDAQSLHEGSEDRPYTISLLERPNQKSTTVPKFRIRVTLLDDALLPLLLRLQTATFQEPLTIGQQTFNIQSIHLQTGTKPGWTGMTTWAELLQQAGTSRTIRLELSTPTNFRQQQNASGARLEMPLPLPELLLGGALRRWQRWSDIPLPDSLREVLNDAMEVTFPLKLEAYEMVYSINQTARNIVGCAGSVTYRVTAKDLPVQTLKQLNALADSLFFTGAGQKTTMGMGRIRRLNTERL